MKISLVWLEKTVIKWSLWFGDPLPRTLFLYETAIPQYGGGKPQAHSHAKHLNPTVEKSGQEHTTEGCIIIFWIFG